MRTSWIASALLGLAVMAHASVTRPVDPPQDHQELINNAEENIDQGVAYLRDGNSESAAAALDKAIHSPVFAELPPNDRKRALVVSGLMAYDKRDYATALGLLKQATAISSPDRNEKIDKAAWNGRLESAVYVQDYRDGALSATYVAQHWPTAINALYPGAMYQIEAGIKGTDADLERNYLQALFDMNWDDHFGTTNNFWRDLSLLWLKKGDMQRALLVSQRITSARTVVSMLVDKRFDHITQAQSLDINQIIQKELAGAKAAVSAAPDELKFVAVLQDRLLDAHHYAEALSVSDGVIAKVGDGGGAKAYKDFDQFYVWVLDERARTLVRLGRWDDAVNQWRHAARRPEQGGMNVSQVINLAALYTSLQRPGDALDTLSDLGQLTPYGRMQLESVKLRVAIEQKDKAAIAEHLDYLRAHRVDAISTWQAALIVTDNKDAAADLLVERLSNESWRSEALVDMQDFLDTAETPFSAEEERRWKDIVADPKVQRELVKVGRVEHFNMDPF
jgi:beta-barrel assembly-enhancing protease